jgi:hypothetical protein
MVVNNPFISDSYSALLDVLEHAPQIGSDEVAGFDPSRRPVASASGTESVNGNRYVRIADAVYIRRSRACYC